MKKNIVAICLLIICNNLYSQDSTKQKRFNASNRLLKFKKSILLPDAIVPKASVADTNKYFLAVKNVFNPEFARPFLQLDTIIDLPNGGKFINVICRASNTNGWYQYYYFKNKIFTYPYIPKFISSEMYAIFKRDNNNKRIDELYNNKNVRLKTFTDISFVKDFSSRLVDVYCINNRIIFTQNFPYCRFGLMNSVGKVIIKPVYRELVRISNKLYAVKNGKNKWLILNANNKTIVKNDFQKFIALNENYFIGIQNYSSSISSIGNEESPTQSYYLSEGDYYLISTSGKILQDTRYHQVINEQGQISTNEVSYYVQWLRKNKKFKNL